MTTRKKFEKMWEKVKEDYKHIKLNNSAVLYANGYEGYSTGVYLLYDGCTVGVLDYDVIEEVK